MAPIVVERVRGLASQTELIAVGVANLFPLVGVVVLGWNVGALLLLYWLELAVLCLLALVRATFAGRPSEFDGDPLIVGAFEHRRVTLSIPKTDVGIRLSTLPVLVAAVPLLTLIWFFAGVMTVGVLGDPPDSDTLEMVIVSGFGILVSESARTIIDYFYRGEYREHSAQTAIQSVIMRGFAIGMGALFTVMSVAIVSDSVATDEPITALESSMAGPPLLVGIVLIKFIFDLAGMYRDRLVTFDESTSVLLGWAYEPPTDEPADTSLSSNASRVRPDVRGRLLGGIPRLRQRPAVALVSVPILLVALTFAIGQVWTVVGLLIVAACAVPLGLLQIDSWLRYAAVEYRTDEDAVIAYDRVFRTTLWRIEPWDETGLRIERDWLDGRLDTSTLIIELRDNEERRLPWLRTVDPILDTFDRRADHLESSGPVFRVSCEVER